MAVSLGDNISVLDGNILLLLRSQNSASAVAKSCGRHRSNVSRSLRRLVLGGFVRKENGLYYLTTPGAKVIDGGCITPLDGYNQVIRPPRKFWRLHDLSFEVFFWVVPVGWEEFRRNRIFELGVVNDFQFNDKFRGGGLASMVLDGF